MGALPQGGTGYAKGESREFLSGLLVAFSGLSMACISATGLRIHATMSVDSFASLTDVRSNLRLVSVIGHAKSGKSVADLGLGRTSSQALLRGNSQNSYNSRSNYSALLRAYRS